MIYALLLCTLMMNPSEPLDKGTLELEITNIRDTRGVIRVGLFNKESDFPDQKKVCWSKALPAQKGKLELDIPELPHGNYALAIYHDLNNNGQLDKNMWGIPTEPYGFSNAVKAKWSAPAFGDAVFSFPKSQQRLSVTLNKWEEL